MAAMKRCCCCGIRKGSLAVGIYHVVISCLCILSGAVHLIGLSEYKEILYDFKWQMEELENNGYTADVDVLGDLDIDSFITALKAEYWYSFLCNGLLLVAGLILIQGIRRDKKEWLIPFMAAKVFGFTLYLFAVILASYSLSKVGMQVAGIGVVVILLVIIPSLIIDIFCILCVLSQYQEYRDGRGRLSDELSLTQHQTESGGKQQPAGTGGFSYQNMPDDGPENTPPPYNAQVP